MINVLKRTIFAFIAIFDDHPNIQVLVAQVRVGMCVDMCVDMRVDMWIDMDRHVCGHVC